MYNCPLTATRLQESRDRILRQALESSTERLQNVASLQLLKGEYNHISEELESLALGPFPDPLTTLPSELWVQILQEAMEGQEKPIHQTLICTLVCKAWCDAIIATPVLWCELVLGEGLGEGDAQAHLATALCLSQGSPISVLIELQGRDLDLSLSLLRPHANRIKQFIFEDGGHRLPRGDTSNTNKIRDIFLSFDKLPILRSLIADTFERPSVDWQTMLDQTSLLTGISGIALNTEHLLHRNLRFLQTVETEVVPSTLPYLPYLTSLTFMPSNAHLSPESWHISHPGSSASFPALREFVCLRKFDQEISSLLSAMTLVTEMELLFVDITDLPAFFSILTLLPGLHTLQFNITFSSFDKLKQPTRKESVLNQIRELSISLPRAHYHAEERKEDILLDILEVRFPNVRNLDMDSLGSQERFTAYILSLRFLLRLSLKSLLLNTVLRSNTIEDLCVEGLILSFDLPRLSNFAMTMYGVPGEEPKVKQDPAAYACVRWLKVCTRSPHWRAKYLLMLKTIHIDDTSNRCATSFLIELIQTPQDCPLLEEIILSSVPEWDVLFMMLERRNFLPKSYSVSPIKCLTLRRLPHPSIHSRLSELLRCRFIDRPSYLELSLSGIIDLYFDVNVSGCDECIAYRWSCAASLIQYRQRTPQEPIPASLDFNRSLLPADIGDWLYGRSEGIEAWNVRDRLWSEQGVMRLPRCGKFGTNPDARITGFSMSGIHTELNSTRLTR